MPFISCLVSKVATEWPYLLFYPQFSGLIPPNVLGVGQSYFVHPQTVLQISIPFQRSYIGQQVSCCYIGIVMNLVFVNIVGKYVSTHMWHVRGNAKGLELKEMTPKRL